MTRDRRLLVPFLLILLTAYGLFAVEARHRAEPEDAMNDARHRNRHRHRHEPSHGRRNRHELADRRSSGWSQELDFEDDSLPDRGEREDEEEEEDDYDARPYYERSYPRSSRIAAHGPMYDPRYPPRYHHRGGYRGTGWYYEPDEERRRGSPRYSVDRGGYRTHRRPGYARNRDSEYDTEEEAEDEVDYEKIRRLNEDSVEERHRSPWKNGRKHRLAGYRRDWRPDGRKWHRPDDLESSRRFDDRRRRSNSSESRFASYSKTDRRRFDNFEDYEYQVDEFDDGDKNVDDEEDEEENVSREIEDEDVSEDADEELDNDFYRGERKPLLKTYDDIIRRLTSNDPTTSRPTGKRDYRNIEIDRSVKRDAFGNFKYEPRNLTRPLVRDRTKIVGSPYGNAVSTGHQSAKRFAESYPGKLLGTMVERKLLKTSNNLVAKKKIDDTHPRTKSLEQDYDEYLNTSDNEKEEDLVKTGAEEDTGMQADVTNTEYNDDEEEEETPAATTVTTTPRSTTSSTTTPTTTTSTTTTPRPVVTQNYDYRDPRSYEGRNTGPQYNGYQSKNDYPPMSAHSVHKWQTLGNRESVKETRSNMQQYNKNGKTAEIQEALQHASKVLREGSCQWPRPRVIPVRDIYPSPSTTYIPHCAILHRCSDDTGCCRSEALTCVPKHSHRVQLSFYTTNVGSGSVVEKLSFYNHTECECRERTEYDTGNGKLSEQRVYRHHQPSPQPQNMRRAQPRKPCRCPSEFTPRITSVGECQCNCYEHHQNCIRIRRGKGYFSIADRLCIQNEECAMPNCEFGEYMRRQGKCPRKKDKFDAIANYQTNFNHRYRS